VQDLRRPAGAWNAASWVAAQAESSLMVQFEVPVWASVLCRKITLDDATLSLSTISAAY